MNECGQYCVDVSTSGVAGGRSVPRSRFVPRWIREFLFVVVIYAAYEASRGLHQGAASVATRNGWSILRWEQAWDLAPEHLLSQALIHVTPLAVAAAYFYSTMHYVITPVVLLWLYRRRSDRYRPARTTLAISTIIGLVGFYVLPTAPPRLLTGSGIPDTLFDVRNWGWWGSEGSIPRGFDAVANQFAAMPSMHVGWALWCGVLVFGHASRRWVRWTGAAYPVLTALVVLSTGNHYFVDAVAGAAVMATGVALTSLLSWAKGQLAVARTPVEVARAVPGRALKADGAGAGAGAWLLSAAHFGVLAPTSLTLTRHRIPAVDESVIVEEQIDARPTADCVRG